MMPEKKGFEKADDRGEKAFEPKGAYENLGDGWPYLIAIMRWFPDFTADLFQAENAEFNLAFIQRIFMRIEANYKDVAITACRGATKSYTTDLGELVDGLMWPGQQTGIIAPTNKQGAEIERKIFQQLENNYPALLALYKQDANSVAAGRFTVSTPYGSEIAIGSFRGNTIHKAIAEETAQEETGREFDADAFREVVLPAIRGRYRIEGAVDPVYVRSKVHSITSAGRRQNYAYERREICRRNALAGKSAYYIDIPFDVCLLEQLRDVAWAENQRDDVTISGWLREMCSIYSGSDKNPMVRDSVLTESRDLLCMEEHSCLKDRDNKLKPEDVIYVIGNDVSYSDGKDNAKCATVVVKLTKQTKDWLRRDKYRKDVVWIEDWSPAETPTPIAHAKRLKKIWSRYCFEGSQTYIAIDAWQYGTGVVTALMQDLGDGMQPLCCYGHSQFTELELEHAIPVIYPIRAGGVGTTDPDSDMVLNAEQQFENGNVHLLTPNMNEGVAAYKNYHRIKTDEMDYAISLPYKKTNELIYQIQNLREEASGAGIREKRISNRIQRDSWSALKYALRFAQILERIYLQARKKKSDWEHLLKSAENGQRAGQQRRSPTGGRKIIGRQGGRLF